MYDDIDWIDKRAGQLHLRQLAACEPFDCGPACEQCGDSGCDECVGPPDERYTTAEYDGDRLTTCEGDEICLR